MIFYIYYVILGIIFTILIHISMSLKANNNNIKMVKDELYYILKMLEEGNINTWSIIIMYILFFPIFIILWLDYLPKSVITFFKLIQGKYE